MMKLFQITLLIFLLANGFHSANSQQPEIVKLRTLDIQGRVQTISDDGRYIVVDGENDYLVNAFTGEIVYTTAPDELISLHPAGTHYLLFGNINDRNPVETSLIDITSGETIY